MNRQFEISRRTPPRAGANRFPARLGAALVLVALSGPVGRAQSTNTPGRPDYQAFKIIAERNIFDPNRSPRSGPRRDSRRPTRVESFALVGTLSYEKGTYAFFDGSDSAYRKALQTGDTIAGCKIAAITADRVKLEVNGQQVELSVGTQMKKQDEGEWQLAGRAESFGLASRAESGGAAISAPAANEKTNGNAGGEDNDVLKRLLQKREQELK